ncbi:MAG: class I SAM-dependent methyltransferase [Candidatus Falkowbacteria bacterium]
MKDKIKNKLLNIVKNGYETNADEFSNTRNYVWPELHTVITAVRNSYSCSEQQNVLDLGCGNGRLFELFRDTDVKYTGIDQSHNLIKLAQKKYPEAKFIQGDILNINKITDDKYDLILLIAVLPHIPSRELRLKLLKQIKNHLTPNGKFIIACWNLRARLKYKKLIWKYSILKLFGLNKMDFGDILFTGFAKKSERYYHAFTKKELQKLLEQAGFKIKKIYSDDKNIYATCTIK